MIIETKTLFRLLHRVAVVFLMRKKSYRKPILIWNGKRVAFWMVWRRKILRNGLKN